MLNDASRQKEKVHGYSERGDAEEDARKRVRWRQMIHSGEL